ncbi:DUF1844 domain-containing protein [Limisphaera sp. 4302-co]|uniref:DUF1844 domain-containing protein n=1 Tax=Limisphaera sp. 4302-co TaxID=3400417 RepID=UPI003C18DCEE
MTQENRTAHQAAGEFTSGEQSVLFARLILQLADLANVMLGRIPNPATGETTRDLDAARIFIDQLSVLELKTRGNLTPEESRLLRDTLMNLRLAFVEAVETARDAQARPAPSAPGETGSPPPGTPSPSEAARATSQPDTAQQAESESRRRFFKKYDV